VRATFERFDADRNGQLDFRELRAALAAAGLDSSSAEAAQLIGRHDRDGRRVTLPTTKVYLPDSLTATHENEYTRDSHYAHTTAAVSWSSPSSPISSASCARRRVTRWPPSSARCVRSSASRLRRPRDDDSDEAWA
jgi:hypothetical protein